MLSGSRVFSLAGDTTVSSAATKLLPRDKHLASSIPTLPGERQRWINLNKD